MVRKKKSTDDPDKNKQPLLEEEEDKSALSQFAQGPLSDKDLEKIIKQLLKQQHQQIASQSDEASTSSTQPGRQTRSQTKSGSSTPKPESSTLNQSQTQGLSSKKPVKKTIDSYVKTLPTENWTEVLTKKNRKTPPIDHDKLALSLIASSSQAITKQEYDSSNEEFTRQLAQKKPPQVSKPLTVVTTPVINQLDTPYIEKQNVLDILQIEPEFFLETPNQVAMNVFPSGWHFIPTNFPKNHMFYELILVDSKSIGLVRHPATKTDQPFITHSTLQILQVLTPTDWNQNLNKPKFFTKKVLELDGYTYWDYCAAWYNIFWDQNRIYKHTWFIYFDKKIKYTFPQWFLKWWHIFRPISEILPPIIQEALTFFQNKFRNNGDPFPIDLHYFSKLGIAWIFSWQYKFSHNNRNSSILPTLQRQLFVRWWKNYKLQYADRKAVDKWFKENPQFLSATEESRFLNQKNSIQYTLAAAKDKKECINQLSIWLKQLQQSEDEADTEQHISDPDEMKKKKMIKTSSSILEKIEILQLLTETINTSRFHV